MAAANESQGLKIAVAVFVALSVILAVSTYFGFKYYGEADALMIKAQSDLRIAKKAADDTASTNEMLRKEIGVKAEGNDEIKAEIKKEYAKVDTEIKALVDQVNAAVAKAQQKGLTGTELEEAKANVARVASAYQGELNKSYISSLDNATALMKNLGLLTNQLALDYTDVKRGLESADTVNAQKIAVVEKSFNDSKSDLAAEQQKHVDERQTLLTKVDQYQTDNAKLSTEVQNLTTKMRQMEEDFTKKLTLAQQTVRDFRDRLERKEVVLDRPDGNITYVDYNRNEIHANLTRAQGARPQMEMAIFDSNSPGIPTDRPKGTITLTQVGDTYSVGHINKTFSSIDPIKVGDIIYSAAWSPNEPMRFALIGKIDINRDGADDREDLKRMITAAGGIVDYDLPPPDAGKESGKLTGKDAWYVIDDRTPLREVYAHKGVTINENAEFLKKSSEAVREARLNGVRPMLIERLLPYLGYDMNTPITGRAEAFDTKSMRRVLMPRQNPGQGAPAPAPAAATPPAVPKPDTPEAKEETPK